MYEGFYERISAPWRAMKHGATKLGYIDTGLRVFFVCLYGMLLIWLAVSGSPLLLRAALVPLSTFVLVSMWRSTINWKRPYELHSIDPLIKKDTQGKSFPSRHMASAVIIACTLIWLAAVTAKPLVWIMAALASIACAAVAYVRLAGGVHFPRDIIAGAITSIVLALLGFVAIP